MGLGTSKLQHSQSESESAAEDCLTFFMPAGTFWHHDYTSFPELIMMRPVHDILPSVPSPSKLDADRATASTNKCS